MNYSTNIIEYLERLDRIDASLVLAANAPPMARTLNDMRSSMSTSLTAEDVLDTFRAFLNLAPNADQQSKRQEGTFSFGVKGSGRFRVHHLTQRNSRVLTISRIPNDIPDINDLTSDRGAVSTICDRLLADAPSLIIVTGRHELYNAILVYSLLKQINETGVSKLMYVVEPSLTFLMKNQGSVVVQCELHSDVEDIPAGVHSALNLSPDIAYFGSVYDTKGIELLNRLFVDNRRVVLSSSTLTPQALMSAVRQSVSVEAVTASVQNLLVSITAEPSGHLGVQVMDAP